MKHRRWIVGGLLAVCLCLGGCGQLEIEERAFPLALAIAPADGQGDYAFTFFFEEMESAGSSLYHKENIRVTADGYAQAYMTFGRAQAAQPDDSHMQVILLSEQLLDDQAFLDSFYSYAMKEHHFSWNTMVYLTTADASADAGLAEYTGGRPGSYLRDMAQSDEQEKTAGVPTLGDLYMEQHNREKVLLLPVLREEMPPYVDHYRLLVCGQAGESVDRDEARLIQLLQGRLDRMQMELENGTILKLEGIRSGRRYMAQTGRWQVTLHMEAGTLNRLQLSAKERSMIRQEAVSLLQKRLAPLTKWAPVRNADGQMICPEYVLDLQVID